MSENNCCGSNNQNEKKSIRLKPRIEKVQDCKDSSCCCSKPSSEVKLTPFDNKTDWITGEIKTAAGIVPKVSTEFTFKDMLGSWKARWGINRMNYKINPGIYAVGNPDENSPVMVTANYKMTFDRLRSKLTGLNAWVVVLDTKGINVWCAAGKGTFGTNEIINRIKKVRLSEIVSHRTIILPQLGAPGVAAHEVQKNTGFKTVYGPIRADDIKEFMEAGMKATPDMREVRFSAFERLILTPIELVGTIKVSFIIFGILFVLNQIGLGAFGAVDLYAYIGALISGCVLTPLLLPMIPGRAFALKGWILGLIWAVCVNMINGWPGELSYHWVVALAYLLILPAVSSFYAMNFTGASTFTSFSGVLKEMQTALPAIIISIGCGIVLFLVNGIIIV